MRAHWTQEQTEDLKHMMSKGLAAREIAEQLAVSKNAVVGKMHRLRIKHMQKYKIGTRISLEQFCNNTDYSSLMWTIVPANRDFIVNV